MKRSKTLRKTLEQLPKLTRREINRLEAFAKKAPDRHGVHMFLVNLRQHYRDISFDIGLPDSVLDTSISGPNERTYRHWSEQYKYAKQLLARHPA